MRALGGLSLALLLCLTSRGQAQVSVDLRALDPNAPKHAPTQAAPRHPAAPPARTVGSATKSRTATKAEPTGKSLNAETAKPQSAPTTGTPAPSSAAPASGPIPALPVIQPSEPPPATTVPAPEPTRTPLPAPVRLVFEDGQTELSPGDEAEIKDLARSIPSPETNSVSVVAYAAGKQDDPSTARRVSLSRGMAVRSVLLASGVPSARIYVRALGATASDGPADRVELVVAPIGTVTR